MFIERLEERRVMSSPYSITVLDPRKWMEIIQGNMEANGWGDYHKSESYATTKEKVWCWGWTLPAADEMLTSQDLPCESLEDGKTKAQALWTETLSPALAALRAVEGREVKS